MYIVCLGKLIKLGLPSCLHKLMQPSGEWRVTKLQSEVVDCLLKHEQYDNSIAKTKLAQFIYGNRRDTIIIIRIQQIGVKCTGKQKA